MEKILASETFPGCRRILHALQKGANCSIGLRQESLKVMILKQSLLPIISHVSLVGAANTEAFAVATEYPS